MYKKSATVPPHPVDKDNPGIVTKMPAPTSTFFPQKRSKSLGSLYDNNPTNAVAVVDENDDSAGYDSIPTSRDRANTAPAACHELALKTRKRLQSKGEKSFSFVYQGLLLSC